MVHLQGVRQELVHLGDAGGDAEVDGAVADLDDEPADDVGVDLKKCVRVDVRNHLAMLPSLAGEEGAMAGSFRVGSVAYLVGDLELLALADVGGLGDGSLEAGQSLAVEGLIRCVSHAPCSVRDASHPCR